MLQPATISYVRTLSTAVRSAMMVSLAVSSLLGDSSDGFGPKNRGCCCWALQGDRRTATAVAGAQQLHQPVRFVGRSSAGREWRSHERMIIQQQ